MLSGKLRWALLLIAIGIAFTVGLRVRPAFDDEPDSNASINELKPSSDPSPTPIKVTFGLSRETKSRVRVFRKVLEDEPPSEPSQPSEEGASNRSGSTDAGDTQMQSPDLTVASARLEGDLTEVDGDHEFPANQIIVGAASEGATGLKVTMTFNPAEPEPVDPGTYEGKLIVEGARPQPFVYPLEVTLSDRGGTWALLAAGMLAVGALLGLAVKWMTESLTTLGALRRQVRRLERHFTGVKNGLPVAVLDRLEDLRQRIVEQDVENVAQEIKEINDRKQDLKLFAVLILEMHSEVRKQREQARKIEPLSSAILDALEQETTAIEERGRETWPWENAGNTLTQCRTTGRYIVAFGQLFQYFPEADGEAKNQLLAIIHKFAEGKLEEGMNQWLAFTPKDSLDSAQPALAESFKEAQAINAEINRSAEEAPRREGPVEWALRHARILAALASVVVVMLVGLQTEYLDEVSFEQDLGSWLGLLIWAFAVELSGVSIVEVLGKLTPSTSAGRSPTG